MSEENMKDGLQQQQQQQYDNIFIIIIIIHDISRNIYCLFFNKGRYQRYIYIYMYIKEGGGERENQKEAKIINRYCSVFELKYNSNL